MMNVVTTKIYKVRERGEQEEKRNRREEEGREGESGGDMRDGGTERMINIIMQN